MAEILLVNPRKRKSRRGKRRMSALQRKYFGGGRKKRRAVARAANPRRRKRRKQNVYINPSPRRKRRSRRTLTRGARRRRNPSLRGMGGSVINQVMPTLRAGFIGAAGAIGLDLLWGYGKAYLPASIAGSPLAQYGAKLLGAIAVGMIGGKVLRGRGRDLATGAATVVIHDALKAQIQASFPAVQLGEYLSYAPVTGYMPRAGQLLSTGLSGQVGEYLSGLPHSEDDQTYSGDWTGDGMNGY